MRSKSDVEVTLFAEEHRDQLRELQKRLRSPSVSLNDPYFRWKYDLNPNAAKGAMFLAMAEGRVVGARGFMASTWKTNLPGCESIPLAGDTTIHPDFEGTGLVQLLTEAGRQYFAERGVAVLFNTSASPAVHFLSLRAGWKAIGEFRFLGGSAAQPFWFREACKIAGKTPLLWRLVSSRFLPDIAAIDEHSRLLRSSQGHRHSLSISNNLDPSDAAALVEAHGSAGKHVMVRDAAFFAWRFKNPYYRYHFLTCREDGQLAGYFALRQNLNDRSGNVRIIDWFCADLSVFRRLLAAMLHFRGNQFEIAAMALTSDEVSELRRNGFTDVTPAPPEGIKKSLKYQPSVLAISTGAHTESFTKLVAGGFELVDFKGIESDCT